LVEVREDEFSWRQAGDISLYRPLLVIEVKDGLHGDGVHVGGIIGVDVSDVAPIAALVLGLAWDDVACEVIGIDAGVFVQFGEDGFAEVMRGVGVFRIPNDFVHEDRSIEEVVTHGGQAHFRVIGHGGRVFGFFEEVADGAVGVDVDDAELGALFNGNGDGCDRTVCLVLAVEGRHLLDVHNINMVSAEDIHMLWLLVGDEVEVLEDGVDGAFIPVSSRTHLCGDRLAVVADEGSHSPGAGEVVIEGVGLILGEDFNFINS